MSQINLSPNPGEIWHLKILPQEWSNGVVLAVTDDGKSFVTAQIISTELPASYVGANIEIHDSFTTNVPVPFVVNLDELQTLPADKFESKRGRLNDEDWTTVSNAYLNLSK